MQEKSHNTKKEKILFSLFALHLFIIALSNYLVQFPYQFFWFSYTWAMFTYPVIILASDLTTRMMGIQVARKIVLFAYLPAIFLSWYFADFRIAFASATAYLLGLLLDIFVFQKIREHYQNSWWLPPFISSIIAAIIDTYLFYALAFHASSDAFMAENWVSIANTDLALKIAIAIFVFIPLYGILLSFIIRRIYKKQ